MRRSIATAIGVAAGVGAAAVTRRITDGPDPFYAWDGERRPLAQVGAARFSLPITYHRSEQVVSVHAIAFEATRALLPTDALHPVRLPDGHALLAVTAARYLEGTAEGMDPRELPYGETMIMVFVTRTPSRPFVPILRGMLPGAGQPPMGGFLLHLATTYRAGRDLGRALGYPAFTADFAFEDDVCERRVSVAEGGREILRQTVATRGRVTADRRPSVVYTVRGEELLETVSPCSGYLQQRMGSHSGSLQLGDHPVADMVRALEPSPTPVVTRSYLNLRLIVPAPRVVGAARPYTGYAGGEQDHGAYTIRYPDGSVIDVSP
jgi:Acetoacetate decarboxylase (ADC)